MLRFADRGGYGAWEFISRGFDSPALGALTLMVAMTVPVKKGGLPCRVRLFRWLFAQNGRNTQEKSSFARTNSQEWESPPPFRQGRSLAANALTSF